MLHLTTTAVAWALIGVCLVSAAAHSQTKPVNKIETGTVSGRVTVKGKGKPGIVVSLRAESNQGIRPSLKATTDEEGKYRIINVPAGAYKVVPIAPVFVFFALSNSGSRGIDLLIAEGEAVEGFDFAMVRGGVITGRVTDADGRPVVEEFVHLSIESQTVMLPASSAVYTDDRGIYRAFGVPAGRYRVSAAWGASHIGRLAATYRLTFHPSTTESAQATLIEVGEATEATNVDITLVRMSTGVAASGRVIHSKNGEPVPNVPLELAKITVEGSSRSSIGGTLQSTNKKGEFRAEGLTPGKYIVSVSQQRENLRADPVAFDVLDQDVTGLLIKTSVGATLSGTIVLEGSSQNASAPKLTALFITAHVRDEASDQVGDSFTISSASEGSGRLSKIGPDGRFHLSGLPAGRVHLSLGAGPGIVISRIERDGVVQPDGIVIQNEDQVTGLRVTVAQNSGTIRGQVKFENGSLPSDGSLYVTIVKVGEQSNATSPRVDARGAFIAEGLSSGTYELEVHVFMPQSNRELPSSKQLVTVAEGVASEVTITITVDLNQTPRPTP